MQQQRGRTVIRSPATERLTVLVSKAHVELYRAVILLFTSAPKAQGSWPCHPAMDEEPSGKPLFVEGRQTSGRGWSVVIVVLVPRSLLDAHLSRSVSDSSRCCFFPFSLSSLHLNVFETCRQGRQRRAAANKKKLT